MFAVWSVTAKVSKYYDLTCSRTLYCSFISFTPKLSFICTRLPVRNAWPTQSFNPGLRKYSWHCTNKFSGGTKLNCELQHETNENSNQILEYNVILTAGSIIVWPNYAPVLIKVLYSTLGSLGSSSYSVTGEVNTGPLSLSDSQPEA